MKKILILLISLFVLFACEDDNDFEEFGGLDPREYEHPQPNVGTGLASESNDNTISVMSFNIQIFGVTKASKPEVMNILADIIMMYDITAIQEIRDASGTAIIQLMSLLPDHYDYVIGPREGRTRSKEQYAFVYDSRVVAPIAEYVYPDPNDVLERSPHTVHFQSLRGWFDFVVINNHMAPGDAEAEIEYTPYIVELVEQEFNEPDVIILGDFNADGSYYDEEELIDVFHSDFYASIVTNDTDTTVSANDYTYDRIIITNNLLEDYSGSWGVLYFENEYDFSSLTIEPKEVSDHYPVYAEFYVDRDSE